MLLRVRYLDDEHGWTFSVACEGCGQDGIRMAGTPGHSPRMRLPQHDWPRMLSKEEVQVAALRSLEAQGWREIGGRTYCRYCGPTEEST